jgi:hypothetical protein
VPGSFLYMDRMRAHPGIVLALLATAAPVYAERLALQAADGRRTVQAVELRTPIVLDGVLDDEAWADAEVTGEFVQAEPDEGEPASEPTEVRVAFDREALYIAVYCRDREAASLIVNDIRKDFALGDQDSFEILLDTFGDRRNGFVFITNPEGAKSDTQIANEGREVNTSWDAVWRVAAKTQADGWTAEIWIPFKTLRFEPGEGRSWGVNFARRIRRKNEVAYWSAVPRAYSIYRASQDGNLFGLPDVDQGRNLRVKPFFATSSTRATGGRAFDGTADVGVDLKYGVTPALTLDLTVNPDFAQAEADEQQVNLTRFSLFYPEKREFFLENSGIFYFGDIPRNSRQTSRFRPPEEDLLLFFSRRIGLTDDGQQIPIIGGARLTGRAAGFGVGVLSMQTDDVAALPGTNYTVVRARRDVLRNSDIGAIFMNRQSTVAGDYNRVVGADANFRFLRNLSWNSFFAKSETPGAGGGELAWKTSLGWEDNFHHYQYSVLNVDDSFQADIGFVRRTGVRKHFVDAGIRPRPQWLRKFGFIEFHPHNRLNRYTDLDNDEVTRSDHWAVSLFFERGGFIEYAVNPRMDTLITPFDIRPDVSIPVGRYDWNEYQLTLETDRSRVLSGSFTLTNGGFWDGAQNAQRIAVVLRPSYRLLVDVGLQRNDITLHTPVAAFTTNLLTVRTAYSFSTNMFLDSLLQYNTDVKQFNANVRFNLIHRPLSDLFVVYNEQQFTERPDLVAGRAVILKYTHMLSF